MEGLEVITINLYRKNFEFLEPKHNLPNHAKSCIKPKTAPTYSQSWISQSKSR